MPKGVRRNPFQTLLTTAEKQLGIARERLAKAEHDADCIHQKRIRVARVEHDEWTKMVKQLRTSLTIPQLAPVPPPPPVTLPPDMVIPEPASKKQSNNDAGHGPNGQADAGDRMPRRGPQLTGGKPGPKKGIQSRFDKCPGLPNLQCRNSKPTENELCGRCQAIRGIPPVPRPRVI